MAMIAVDLPEQLLAELSDAAAQDERSIEATVISALEIYLAGRRGPRAPNGTLQPPEPPD